MYHQFKELAEVDITAEPMEVGPTLHYFMGGIKVDHNTQSTNIPGLYACGNCTSALLPKYPGPGSTLGPAMTFGYLAAKHITGVNF